MFRIVIHGAILSLVASAFSAITMQVNPRIWLEDYPRAIQDLVPPKRVKEKELSLIQVQLRVDDGARPRWSIVGPVSD